MKKINIANLLLPISFFGIATFCGCTSITTQKPEEPIDAENPFESEQPSELETPNDDGTPVLDDPKTLAYIVAEKSSSHTGGRTAHPGEEITFTFSIKNGGEKTALVSVSDMVPENTSYVSGCDEINGDSLYWTVSVESGETEMVSYTVEVNSDLTLCENGSVTSAAATVGGSIPTDCPAVYIKRTLNKADQDNISTAIKALTASGYKGGELVKWIYNVAFSHSFLIDGTPSELLDQILIKGEINNTSTSSGNAEESTVLTLDLLDMVVPTLFGGTSLPTDAGSRFGSVSSGVVSTNGLIAGDILLTQADISTAESGKIYMYDGKKLANLTNGVENVNTHAVLSKINENALYVVLRPSFELDILNYSKADKGLTLTPAQEAIIATAKSYLLRGERMQYDDTSFGSFSDAEHRWQKGVKAPEDYTVDEWGYSNCAAFTYDVYYFGLGYDIGTYTTGQLIESASNIRPYYYAITGNESGEQQNAVEQEFNDALQPGDIIVIRYKTGGGHAMLYVGNGKIIHSSGSNYNYGTSTEVCEPTIRFMQVKDLFTPGNKRHIFSKIKQLGIVRPLNAWAGTIPENSVNRVKNMQGVVAEKLSSHTSGMTANPGDEITFTYSIFNSNSYAVTLDISDVVPQNTTYVSGAQTTTGNNLSWKVTVPAGEAVTVSYQVKVDNGAQCGSYIQSISGKVGGVSTNCKKIYIQKTLTAQEQQKVLDAVETLKNSNLTGLALVNAIYENALAENNVFASTTFADVGNGVFTRASSNSDYYVLNQAGDYSDMLAPTLYGGRRFYTSSRFDGTRTRAAQKQHLIIGDVLIAKSSTAERVWLFVGDGFIELTKNRTFENANSRLSKVLAFVHYYAVLRPSMSL